MAREFDWRSDDGGSDPSRPRPDERATATAAALGTVLAHTAGTGGGAYLGAVPDGWVWSGREHAALVLGPPRSGKTSAVVIPSVVAARGAVVCTSTKPDIARTTAPARRQAGPCLVYDPTGSVPPIPGIEPVRWSPISACRSWDDALVMAAGMVDTARRVAGPSAARGADHWSERAAALLAPLLHAAALDGADMATVVSWVDQHRAGPPLDILDEAGATLAGNLLAGIAATDPREQSGIWSTASGTLSAYRSHAALATTVSPTFDADAFVEARGTLYICASARHQTTVAPLVVGLLTEIRSAVYARAATYEAARSGDGPAPERQPPVLFALDEVANIAPIPDLPAMVSEGGGQGVTVLACLQDLSQARNRWGAAADGLLSLFGATLVLPGIGDMQTLRALSDLAGEEDVVQRAVSAPAPDPRSRAAAIAERLLLGRRPTVADHRPPTVTWSTVRRRRLPIDDVARGHFGAALLLDQRNRLRWIGLTPWFSTEPWRSAVGLAHHLPEPGTPYPRTTPTPTPTPTPTTQPGPSRADARHLRPEPDLGRRSRSEDPEPDIGLG